MHKIYFLALLLFSACKSSQDETVIKPMATYDIFGEKVDSLFNAEIAVNEPGAAVLISYKGQMIIGKGYGLRDLQNNQPITSTTNMRMGSVSKQFTALTILSLVDKGQLSLSDPVFDIFPYESFKDVTIEQLINHTSGLADAESAFFEEWDSTQIAENKDVFEWYKREDRSVESPGVKYQYNNGIYEFIPTIVEKLSGQEFADYAKENVFMKAGMKRTNFFNLAHPVDIEERAYCYGKDGNGEWVKVDGHYLNGLLGAGGVYTSVEDYFTYDLSLRNKSIFSEQTHDLIFKPSSTDTINGKDSDYAMGWGVTDSTAQHTGGWFGTNTFVKRYLDEPLTIAVFMNRETLFDNDIPGKLDALCKAYLLLKTN